MNPYYHYLASNILQIIQLFAIIVYKSINGYYPIVRLQENIFNIILN